MIEIIEISEQTVSKANFPNKAEILSVSDFLSMKDIRIPEYQRPYKWEENHVGQLINDIYHHRNISHYRLGTIVIHQNYIKKEGKIYLDIVDGQQRFTTLRILLCALNEIVKNNHAFEESTCKDIQELKKVIDSIEVHYTNKASIIQINKNYTNAFRMLNKYNDEAVRAFINGCQVVVFYITDVTEAFQFFDSQNSRGKDLYPHDLLKAYHLREFDSVEIEKQTQVVQKWEEYSSNALANVFSEYLYRIKGWAGRRSSRQFTKQHIGMFKGINISKTEQYPYVKNLQIAHRFVDNYNKNYERNIDSQEFIYPFQLDSIMINGRRFFEYVQHYKNIVNDFKQKYNVSYREMDSVAKELNTPTFKLFRLVYSNEKSHREGEKYIKALFECLLIYYIDKFGYSEFDAFVEKAFVWCFSLRFQFQRLGFDSVDNYVLGNNMFNKIKEAILPLEVLKYNLKSLPTQDDIDKFCVDKNRMDNRIAEFFKDRMYYAN